MAVVGAQIVVSSTALALSPPETDTVSGGRLYLRNTHATDTLFIGGSTVAVATGYGLLPLTSITIEVVGGEQLFGIRGSTNDITVHVLRIGG